MSHARLSAINKIFSKIDVTGHGVVTIDDLRSNYDVTNNPKYISGETTRDLLIDEFLNSFQPVDDLVGLRRGMLVNGN